MKNGFSKTSKTEEMIPCILNSSSNLMQKWKRSRWTGRKVYKTNIY